MDFCELYTILKLSLLAITLFFTSSRNSFWIGSYDFSKVGLRRNLSFLPLVAARVYAVLAFIDTVDCVLNQSTTFAASRTVHPASRALGWAAARAGRHALI